MCVQHALPFSLLEGPYCLLCKANYAADAAGYCEPCDSAAAKTAFAVNLAILVLMALGAFALYKCYRKFKKLASKKVKTAVKVGLFARGFMGLDRFSHRQTPWQTAWWLLLPPDTPPLHPLLP